MEGPLNSIKGRRQRTPVNFPSTCNVRKYRKYYLKPRFVTVPLVCEQCVWTDDTPCKLKKLCYCRHFREVLPRLATVSTDNYTSVMEGRLPFQSTQHFDLCGRSQIGSNLFHRPSRQITVHEASGWAPVALLIVELYSLSSASATRKK